MFRVEIETDNAAFEGDNLGPEVAKHLHALAERIRDMQREAIEVMANRTQQFLIRDTLGNRCGAARFTDVSED